MLASSLVNLVCKIARQELYFVMIVNVNVFFRKTPGSQLKNFFANDEFCFHLPAWSKHFADCFCSFEFSINKKVSLKPFPYTMPKYSFHRDTMPVRYISDNNLMHVDNILSFREF